MLPTEVSKHDGTETAAVAALAEQATAVVIVKDEATGRSWLTYPDGQGSRGHTEITPAQTANPGRLKAGVALAEPSSLVEYSKRFTTATGIVVGDVKTGIIVAALDYHTPSVNSDGEVMDGGPKATHNEHRATLTLQPSTEWEIWTGASGKMMSQIEFARFIEENSPDVIRPSGADLLEIARDFHAVRSADFRQIVRTDSDNERLEFSDSTVAGKTTGGQMVEVPTMFVIKIPVYFGEPAVELIARFRWRQEGTALLLGVKLDRLENVRQAEFRRIMTDVAERTGFPAYFGKLG